MGTALCLPDLRCCLSGYSNRPLLLLTRGGCNAVGSFWKPNGLPLLVPVVDKESCFERIAIVLFSSAADRQCGPTLMEGSRIGLWVHESCGMAQLSRLVCFPYRTFRGGLSLLDPHVSQPSTLCLYFLFVRARLPRYIIFIFLGSGFSTCRSVLYAVTGSRERSVRYGVYWGGVQTAGFSCILYTCIIIARICVRISTRWVCHVHSRNFHPCCTPVLLIVSCLCLPFWRYDGTALVAGCSLPRAWLSN